RRGDSLLGAGRGWKAPLWKLAKDRPAAEVVWRAEGKPKQFVYPVNSTPVADGDVLYGVDQPGELRAVKIPSGERLWETLAPTTGSKPLTSGTAFLVKNGDRWFLFSETG